LRIEHYPKKYIIKTSRNVYFGEQKLTEFTIKAIKITNTSNQQINLISIQYILKEGNQKVLTISFTGSALKKRLEGFKTFAERFLMEKEAFGEGLRRGNLQKLLGTDTIWNKNHLSFSTVLKPQEETGIISEQISCFGNHAIDNVQIKVEYSNQEKVVTHEITFPLLEYEVKNQYIFPVKGAWHVIGTFDDYINGHRIMHSQEFAFDLDKVFESFPLPRNKKNSVYPCYNEKVYAVAAGEVIQIYSKIPENPNAGSDLELDDLKSLWEKFGFEPLGPGNFVVLKHAHNEYSFYAHLIPGSIQVNIGDKVKQGDLLGHIGNSGSSDGPHLHFQLMDGPSTQTGRGLPCTFTNLYDCYGNQILFPSITSQIVYTI
jgi:hypothetical protein